MFKTFIMALAIVSAVAGSAKKLPPKVEAVELGGAARAASAPLVATSDKDVSPSKPALETLAKPKSIKKVVEDFDIVTNSEWVGDKNESFAFTNAALIRTPMSFARPMILNFALYPKMSPAITKFEYDAPSQTIEMEGESHGLRMHSWLKVDQRYWDEVHFTIIRGDMTGFKVDAYLWDKDGKTLTVAKGMLPGASAMLPAFVRLVFKPVSEIVLGIATKNFRSYIEDEYKKRKN